MIKEPNNEIKGHMCRTLVRNKKCHYYNMLDSKILNKKNFFLLKSIIEEGDTIDHIYKNEAGGNVMDIEDLVKIGKKLRFGLCFININFEIFDNFLIFLKLI